MASPQGGVLFTATETGLSKKSRGKNLAISPYLSAVNQKLLFADRLLKLVDADDLMVNNRHLAVAIAQSVTLQLHQAWCWHVKDVASHYKLKEPGSIDDVDHLVNALAEEGKTPAEATEMQNLQAHRESWAAALFSAHKQLYILPEASKAQMDSDRLPLRIIGGVESHVAQAFDWSLLEVSGWHQQMQELVDRQRDMMIEF